MSKSERFTNMDWNFTRHKVWTFYLWYCLYMFLYLVDTIVFSLIIMMAFLHIRHIPWTVTSTEQTLVYYVEYLDCCDKQYIHLWLSLKLPMINIKHICDNQMYKWLLWRLYWDNEEGILLKISLRTKRGIGVKHGDKGMIAQLV